jgi:hypothetical protein
MKRILLKSFFVSFFVLLIATQAQAGISYKLEDFESKGLNSGLGMINVDGNTFLKTSISPDLNLGPVGLGVDFNLYLPMNSTGTYPSELNFLTLRHVSYDHEKKFGIKWGRLQSVTFGYGLLMDDFDTGNWGTTEFTNEKAGVLGYATIDPVRVDAMWTAKNVMAGRASYEFKDTFMLGSPIVIGGTYVTDENGVDNDINGNIIQRNSQNGYGVDIGVPLGGEFFTLYTEYAQLIEQGKGASVGFRGTFFNQLDYRAEYRSLGARFVPGYFNNTYEATSYDFSTDSITEKVNGFLVSAASTFMDGAFKGGLIYEKYNDINLLTAAVGWRRFQNTVGVINYTVPFQGKSNAIAEADILYYTGGWLDYVAHIKRVYITTSHFTESWSFGVRANLNKLVPNIPFVN